ncbi:MAG: 4-phosphoerythronate dehydrogenase [Bacteroidota bacterium]
MINVLADRHLYQLSSFLPDTAEIQWFDSLKGIPDVNRDIHALLVRTVTPVNARTFGELPASLTFVGTGSAGSDHIDHAYLEQQKITVADAKGCNANAVAEYVITAILLWKEAQSLDQIGTVGVVGAGHTGSAVIRLLQKLGIEYAIYDPFLGCGSPEEVLACPVLTFHTPLTKDGPYPTVHWLNEEKMATSTFELVINAARGGVIDEDALQKAQQAGSVKQVVLDVWEGEPDFNPGLAHSAFIATPHIAGYSEQAKLNASRIICAKLSQHFGLNEYPPEQAYERKRMQLTPPFHSLREQLSQLHPMLAYDIQLRRIANQPEKARLFTSLRVEHPYRWEYEYLDVDRNGAIQTGSALDVLLGKE